MTKRFLLACILMTTAACSDTGFSLTSPNLTPGKPVSKNQYASQFGCNAENKRPIMQWKNIPENTKSFALTFYDKDAPTGSGFWHWIVTGIPANLNTLPETSLPDGSIEWNNDAGKTAYFGPCPPVGRKHRYYFTLHALDTQKLNIPEYASPALIGFFIYRHTIDSTSIMVTAGPRSPS